MMPSGRQAGFGRQKGTPNKKTVQLRQLAAASLSMALDQKIMPLDIILARMRRTPLPNGQLPDDDQFQAAIAAAPFLHAKLSAVVMKDITPPSVPADLDDRIRALCERGKGRALTVDATAEDYDEAE